MARILFATVPLSGHINPGIPIARRLVERGHEVWWYSGSSFRDKIEETGAVFKSFHHAPEFNDRTVADLNGPVPTRSLLAHASFYIRYVFYKQMPAYYADIKEILTLFPASAIISDEWFSGGIPFSEKKTLPWIIYGNSPVMLVAPNTPAPGTGLMPNTSLYGRHRDAIVNTMVGLLFCPLQRYINKIRRQVGLPKMQHYFFEQNMMYATLSIKFNTPIFEFPIRVSPESLHFVGPILPEPEPEVDFSWLDRISRATKPIVFITQGSIDIYDIRKLIVPALQALSDLDMEILVSTGGQDPDPLRKRFSKKNVTIETYIPYALVMPHLSLMITNGGFGGVSAALNYGVPLVVAGNSEDKQEVAARVVFSGTGIDLRTGRPSKRRIRNAARKILENKGYYDSAQAVMDDFRRHDAVQESVALIEKVLSQVVSS